MKKKVKVKGEGEGRKKMTSNQRQVLAAMKSFNADVERAGYIQDISHGVMRERCKNCTKSKDCNAWSIVCRMVSIAAVAVGMIQKGGVK